MRFTTIRMTLAAVALVSLATMRPVAAQDLILNGGFESNGGQNSNSFNNWTVNNQAGGTGNWYAQKGTTAPLGAFTVPAPTEGSFAAMTDQGGPGSHVLYQDIFIPVDVISGTLSFDLFIGNRDGDFTAQNSLDYTSSPNTQARVDVMSTAANSFSAANPDIYQNIYRTKPGDTKVTGYTAITTNLSALLTARAGQTVRLRFAEVDNQSNFQVGVDKVKLTVVRSPEPGSLAYLALVAVPLAGLIRRKR